MNIITKESLVEGFVKRILKEMFSEYERHESNIDNAGGISFDEYVSGQFTDLGQATYEAIGELYGDCDDAINEVMKVVIKFKSTSSANDYGLTVNDVEFEIANYSVDAPTLLIIPNDDEFPIETIEFDSMKSLENQKLAFEGER